MPSEPQTFYLELGAWQIVRENGRPSIVLHPSKPVDKIDEQSTPPKGVVLRAAQLQAMLDEGVANNRAHLAALLGLSRARITQILGRCQPNQKGGRQ